MALRPDYSVPGTERRRGAFHVLNGPNLNLLGEREREFYGTGTLAQAERSCKVLCKAAGAKLKFAQTNCEGILIEQIHRARGSSGIVINPAGCSYSVPVLDALKACSAPIVEVHVSNVHARSEAWRARTITTAAAAAVISGLGIGGYAIALEFLLRRHRV